MGKYYTLSEKTINGLKAACYNLYKLIADRADDSTREEVRKFKRDFDLNPNWNTRDLDYHYKQPLELKYSCADHVQQKLLREYQEHYDFCDEVAGFIFDSSNVGKVVLIDFVNSRIVVTNEYGSDPRRFWVRFRPYSYISLGKQFYLNTNNVPIAFDAWDDLEDTDDIPTCNSNDLDELEKFLNSL
jgi:hypothetical protein